MKSEVEMVLSKSIDLYLDMVEKGCDKIEDQKSYIQKLLR